MQMIQLMYGTKDTVQKVICTEVIYYKYLYIHFTCTGDPHLLVQMQEHCREVLTLYPCCYVSNSDH